MTGLKLLTIVPTYKTVQSPIGLAVRRCIQEAPLNQQSARNGVVFELVAQLVNYLCLCVSGFELEGSNSPL